MTRNVVDEDTAWRGPRQWPSLAVVNIAGLMGTLSTSTRFLMFYRACTRARHVLNKYTRREGSIEHLDPEHTREMVALVNTAFARELLCQDTTDRAGCGRGGAMSSVTSWNTMRVVGAWMSHSQWRSLRCVTHARRRSYSARRRSRGERGRRCEAYLGSRPRIAVLWPETSM